MVTMSNKQQDRTSVAVPIAIALILMSNGIPASGTEPFSHIMSDWQNRQHRVRNIKYVLTGEALVPKGKVGEALMQKGTIPPKDTKYEKTVSLLLDFENDRIRREINANTYDGSLGHFRPYSRCELFDGKLSKVFMKRNPVNPPELEADLYYVGRDQQGGVHFEFSEFPVFLAHGIVPSGLEDSLVGSMTTPKHLLVSLKGEAIHVHGKAIRDQRECVVLRTQTDPRIGLFYEYWVDVARKSAIVQVASYIKGVMNTAIDIEYQETPHGWLPIAWVQRQNPDRGGGGPGWIEQSCSYRVKDLIVDADLHNDDFDIKLEPGMIVRDTRHDIYRVGEDGVTLVAITGKERGSKSWVMYLVAASLALIVLGFVSRKYAYNRRKSA